MNFEIRGDFDATENLIEEDRMAGLQESHRGPFDLVADKADWRAPIDSFITTDEVRSVTEAVAFFTGTDCTVEYIGRMSEPPTIPDWQRFKVGDHVCRVRSIGYRNGPCGC